MNVDMDDVGIRMEAMRIAAGDFSAGSTSPSLIVRAQAVYGFLTGSAAASSNVSMWSAPDPVEGEMQGDWLKRVVSSLEDHVNGMPGATEWAMGAARENEAGGFRCLTPAEQAAFESRLGVRADGDRT